VDFSLLFSCFFRYLFFSLTVEVFIAPVSFLSLCSQPTKHGSPLSSPYFFLLVSRLSKVVILFSFLFLVIPPFIPLCSLESFSFLHSFSLCTTLSPSRPLFYPFFFVCIWLFPPRYKPSSFPSLSYPFLDAFSRGKVIFI